MGIGDYSTDPSSNIRVNHGTIRRIMADLALAREDGTFGGTVTPPGGPVPVSFQKKTEHNIDLRDYIPAGQHNAIYAGTSDYDALADIHKALNETITVDIRAGPTIQLPYGKLLLSGPIQLKKVVGLVGHGNSADGSRYGTILSWPEGGVGIYVNRFDTLGEDTVAAGSRADGSMIRGLSLVGAGGYDPIGVESGIRLRARAYIADVSITNFAGDGIHASSAGGNINTHYMDRVRSAGNGRHGVWGDGPDFNAGTFNGISCNDNGGYGIADSGFLGNSWFGGHLDGNGLKSQVSHGGNRYYLLTAVDGSAVEPGTDSDVWRLIGAGGVANPTYPAWSAEGTYIRGGPILSDNPNSRSVFIGHYQEPNQPPSLILKPAIYIPGHDTNGLHPYSTCLRLSSNLITRAKIDRAEAINSTLATYADNAAAIAGGLIAGDFYKTATGEVRVRV